MDAGNLIRGGSYAGADLQGGASLHIQQQQQQHHHNHGYAKQQQQQQQQIGLLLHPQPQEIFPSSLGPPCEPDSRGTPPTSDYNNSKRDHSKISTSEDDDLEEGADNHNEAEKGKKATALWHRMKWTDGMVKMLITIVSYIGEDAVPDCVGGRRRRMALLQKKGKWKLVSKVMAERGYFVSPQQCEDKFNDLNKRYKRLNDILGRGTTCEVVENPALLDLMHHVSDKAKEDVRKILSSKHLFYEEMCSYHNGNRLHLPADPSLQHLLQQALHSMDDSENRKGLVDHAAEEELGADDNENDDDTYESRRIGGGAGCFHNHKKMRTGGADFDIGATNSYPSLQDCEKGGGLQSQGILVDINQAFSEGPKDAKSQKHWLMSRSLQLEEQRIQIQGQMMELESHRFKWQRFSKKKDREIEKFRMENERLKLENEHLSLELKRKALAAGLHHFGLGL